MNEVNLGVYENRKIDSKGRIIVPSEFKPEINDELALILCEDFLLVREYNGVLKELKELKEKLKSITDIELLEKYNYDINCITSCLVGVIKVDKQGRMMGINSSIKERYNLEDSVVVEGVLEGFRIWNPDMFRSYQEKHIR